MSDLDLPGDFPFELADPVPDPVMITRPCGCTSMVIEDGGTPAQISWCDEHDPGYEALMDPGCRLCRTCGSCDAGLPVSCTCGPCTCEAPCGHPSCEPRNINERAEP